ncbi:RDD family protein [Sulfitobacter sp. MF3-043]|uniref:RDD family protein n=1 Tax=Sulfitobacter sediminivivens TaxID=3252902 RepID=UPI0036D9DCCB
MPHTPDPDTQPEFYDGIPTKRLLAWVVDMIVIIAMCLMILPFTAFTGIFFFPFLMLVIGFIYRVITITTGSATWGMRLMGMELRDLRDQPFDFGTALFHTLGYSFSWAVAPLQLISVVLMCVSARKQGLSDMVLGSVAVNRRRGV